MGGDGGGGSSGSGLTDAWYCTLVGLGSEGPTGEIGEPASIYDGVCDDHWCAGLGAGGGAYEDERRLLTGAPLGKELGAH